MKQEKEEGKKGLRGKQLKERSGEAKGKERGRLEDTEKKGSDARGTEENGKRKRHEGGDG